MKSIELLQSRIYLAAFWKMHSGGKIIRRNSEAASCYDHTWSLVRHMGLVCPLIYKSKNEENIFLWYQKRFWSKVNENWCWSQKWKVQEKRSIYLKIAATVKSTAISRITSSMVCLKWMYDVYKIFGKSWCESDIKLFE